MKVAITTDWLKSFGGAERVLVELHRLFPKAPIYTAVYDPSGLPDFMQGWDVRPTFLQRVPFARRKHEWFLPLMPMAFEALDMREYDLVITTSSACSKGVIIRSDAVNVCYCHTPPRYLWDLYAEYIGGNPLAPLMAPVATLLRMWDRMAADRVDHFIANSEHTAGRISRHYRRDSEVIYPPVNVDGFVPNGLPAEDFYVVVSRLVSYKRVDLAIDACNRLGRRLVVVGDGPERKRLEAMAGPRIEFAGKLGDAALAEVYARCRALIFPGHEDCGIVPVEVQAAGRPVVALGRGGSLETVIDGVTGVHFAEQTAEGVMDGLRGLERTEMDPRTCRANAERFASEVFRARILESIARRSGLDIPAPEAATAGRDLSGSGPAGGPRNGDSDPARGRRTDRPVEALPTGHGSPG